MMRRFFLLFLCFLLPVVTTGCTASAEKHTGSAQGYGGVLRVTVSLNGDDITQVEVTEHHETEGVGTRAIDVLPDLIERTDSTDVDSVSGATVTSNAIKEAVNQALGAPALPDAITPPDATMGDAAPLEGVGMAASGRIGPGTDEEGNQVYSFNVVFACGSFDQDGRIRSVKVDQLEVLSSQFGGFPTDKSAEDGFLEHVSSWVTKGRKGEEYRLNSGTWREQMNTYEQQMIGKTVAEVQGWFAENFSAETGRPTEAISGATMSLQGEYGNILLAVERAWEDAQRSRPQDSASPIPTDGTMIDTNTQTDMTSQEPAMG